MGEFFLCPSVLFSSATKNEVLPGGFLWKIDGYSKYVCCITAPCVMNKYCLNQHWNWKDHSQLLKYVCFQFVNIALFCMVKEFLDWRFLVSLDSQWIVFSLGLFKNMLHNLLMYTNNFCFGYIAVSCFFETFLAGWVVGKSNFNENPVISLDLNLDFGLRVYQQILQSSRLNLNFQLDIIDSWVQIQF